MVQQVYYVVAIYGYEDDFDKEIVAVYDDERAAKEHMKAANDHVANNFPKFRDYKGLDCLERFKAALKNCRNPYDESFNGENRERAPNYDVVMGVMVKNMEEYREYVVSGW